MLNKEFEVELLNENLHAQDLTLCNFVNGIKTSSHPPTLIPTFFLHPINEQELHQHTSLSYFPREVLAYLYR